jgi:tetratricopeptide (TPR) repeat protein
MVVNKKKYILNIPIVIMIILFMIFLKVYYNSKTEFEKAEAINRKNDYKTAVLHYERAIHWYTPYNKYVSISARRLWEIGNLAEDKGDVSLALKAYRSLRSSFYSVRSVYTPGKEWIIRCDDKIAILVAQNEIFPPKYREKSFEEKKRMVTKTLKKNLAPDVFWSIFLEVGFIGWIGCAIGFIFRVFTGEKGFDVRRALLWGGLIIIFYALWIVGMMRA